MIQWLVFCLCAWAWIGLVAAQDLEPGRRKPPAFGILDETGFFNHDAGTFKRISDQLRKLEADHGFKVYLIVEPVLISGSAKERAEDLFQEWVPDGNGLVIVFESDSRRVGVGRDMKGLPNKADNPARIPSHENTAVLTMAMESVDKQLATEPYLEAFMGKLVTGFDDYFKRRAAPPPPQRTLRIGMLVAGTLALLGLGAIALGGFVRHSSMARVRMFRFPVVDRPERLGAPCGGSVTARGFKPPGQAGA
ncbi:MAG: TPM domain-containing protein [Verrucomicrobiaceae bacterium]|nr:MAG: TPM domain-containing protein [Verrucomicrobiaceae bacterium]